MSRLNGEQIFAVSQRIERNGQFAGAAILSFTSGLMQQIWSSLSFDKKSTVGLFRDDGQLVTRYPLFEGPLDLSKYDLFTTYLPQAPDGIYHAVSPADGVERTVGYRRVSGSPLVALASVDNFSAFANFRSSLVKTAALLIPIAILLAALSIQTLRLLQRDARRRDDLDAAMDRNTTLFKEIHHRVKNNLQAVASLASLSNMPRDVKEQLSQRIGAMASVHEYMYRNDDTDRVDAAHYLPEVIDKVVAGYGRAVSVAYDVSPVIIDRDFATPLALITNEVVSNALKYAFVDAADPRLDVKLRDLGDGRGSLIIADNGPGFDVTNSKSGMGSKLIKAFASQLHGTARYDQSQGTRFELDFALKAPSPRS